MKLRVLDQSGFTLIEIIVVFAIIAILSVIGVASFVNYSRVQTVEAAAGELSSFLVVAKSRAISQVKPTAQIPQCDNTAILNGYRVAVCPTSTSDILCSGAGTYVLGVRCSNVDYKLQTGTLPKNVTYIPSPTSTSFFYPVISSGVVGSGTISIGGYGFTKTITVNNIGGIEVQ